MATKTELYKDLNDQLRALLSDEHDLIANAANLASLLYHGLPDLNWAGFYFLQGDTLVLGLNSDDSVRALKGAKRPYVTFEDRATILAALRSVDVVVGFGERTPEVLLERLRPDVHVKSAQYRLEDLPERTVVEAHGGRIVLAPHLDGRSTTDLVALIRSR